MKDGDMGVCGNVKWWRGTKTNSYTHHDVFGSLYFGCGVGSNGDQDGGFLDGRFGVLGTQMDLGFMGFLDGNRDVWDFGVDWEVDASFVLIDLCLGTHTIFSFSFSCDGVGFDSLFDFSF